MTHRRWTAKRSLGLGLQKKRFFFRLLGGPWPSLPAEPKKGGRNTGLSLRPLEFCDIIQGSMGP
jgi:hypothetical protein